MKVTNRNLPIIYLFFLFFAFLVIHCIFRPFSGDTYNYHVHFLAAQDNICQIEYSFFFLSKLCYFIGQDTIGFRLLLSIYALIVAFFLLELFKKSKSPLLCFLIFYLSFYNWIMCTLMRASVAYILCYSSLYDIANHKKKKAILKILIGTLFHYSVAWFFIIIPLEKRIKNKKELKKFTIFCCVCILIFSPLINLIFSKIQPTNYLFEKLYSYYNSGIYYLHPLSLKSLFLALVFCYFFKKLKFSELTPVGRISFVLLSLFIVFHFFGVFIMGEIGSRLRDFIYIGALVYLPEFIYLLKHKRFITICSLFGFLLFSIKESNLILFFR